MVVEAAELARRGEAERPRPEVKLALLERHETRGGEKTRPEIRNKVRVTLTQQNFLPPVNEIAGRQCFHSCLSKGDPHVNITSPCIVRPNASSPPLTSDMRPPEIRYGAPC